MTTKTFDDNKIFALYDEKDRPLGCFDRKQLSKLLNLDGARLNNVMCRIRKKRTEGVYYKGQCYRVYVYEEDKEENNIIRHR